MAGRAWLGVAVALALLVPTAPATAQTPRQGNDWLGAVNAFRREVGLAKVYAESGMSAGAAAHSRYMVKSGDFQHNEEPDSPWFTEIGNTSGTQSNVAGGTGIPPTAAQTIALWIAAPFHRIGLLRPQWLYTGYSLKSVPVDGRRWGATLNVLGGLYGSSVANWPVVWPNSSRQVDPPYFAFPRVESPDPVLGCRRPKGGDGYGTIITASFGPGTPVNVHRARLRTADGTRLPICVETGTSYARVDSTGVGENLLNEMNTVMVIPRSPLSAATSYRGRIRLEDGRTARIRFSTRIP